MNRIQFEEVDSINQAKYNLNRQTLIKETHIILRDKHKLNGSSTI